MSRSYLLYADFGKMSRKEFQKLLIYYYKWCHKGQVWKTYWERNDSYIYAEMGCSSGVCPSDTATEFYNSLVRKCFPISSMCYWSLHPDNSTEVKPDEI